MGLTPEGRAPRTCYLLEGAAEQLDAVAHFAVAGKAVILAQALSERFHQQRIVGEFGVVQRIAALDAGEVDDGDAIFGEVGGILVVADTRPRAGKDAGKLQRPVVARQEQDEGPGWIALAPQQALEHIDVDVGRGQDHVAELAAEVAVAGDRHLP